MFISYYIHVQCFKNRTEPAGRTGQTANQRGDRSGSNVGSAMQLDRWEPLKTGKTGEPAVFSNRRFECTRFFFLFFSAKSLKTTSFCIFFLNRRTKRNKRESNIEITMSPWILIYQTLCYSVYVAIKFCLKLI